MLSAPPLILLLAVAAAAVAPSAARIVKFAEGSTSIEAVGRVEHVVVRDTKGNVISESRCDSGTFDEYLALFTKLRDAVSRADRSAVVKLVNYPLRVNGKKPLVLQNAASLTKSYEKVFTVTVQEKIRKAEPAAVFCRDGRAMLGDGIIWATATGVAILNP
jgi:hypothetical protein